MYRKYGHIFAPAVSALPPSMVVVCHERQDAGSDDAQDDQYAAGHECTGYGIINITILTIT